MSTNFAIIGGDLRIVKLAEMLSEEGNIIYTYGLDKAEELKKNKNIIQCESINKAVQNTKIVIGPIPFSKEEENINAPFCSKKILVEDITKTLDSKVLIAGTIPQSLYKQISNCKSTNIIDLMKREELTILNTIATAEGTIQIAIENRKKILHGSNILILGFGRVAKVLAHKLSALNCKITCAARKTEDFAWIKTYGYNKLDINKLNSNLGNYDIIINTVPYMILSDGLNYVKKDSLLIDLASNPGGINRQLAEEKGLKLIWALALPGKVAPITSAEFIKNTIYNIIKEI